MNTRSRYLESTSVRNIKSASLTSRTLACMLKYPLKGALLEQQVHPLMDISTTNDERTMLELLKK